MIQNSYSSVSAWTVLLAVVLASFALPSAANAESITNFSVPGAFQQSGGTFQYVSGTYNFFSFGQLGSGGYIRGTNGFNYDLNCGASYMSCAVNGFDPSSGYFFGLGFDNAFTPATLIGNVASGILTWTTAIDIFEYDGMSFAGVNKETNQAAHGDFATFLATGSFTSMLLPPSTPSAAGTAISGNVICTSNSSAVSGVVTVRCYNKDTGVEIPVDRGTASVVRGANSTAGIAWGSRQGCAGFWSLSTGLFTAAPSSTGAGPCQQGEATSWIPGGFAVRSGSAEFLWKPGATITPMATHLAAIGAAASTNNFLTGDAVVAAILGEGSFKAAFGPTNLVLNQSSSGGDDPVAIPEPATNLTFGLGLVALALLAKRHAHPMTLRTCAISFARGFALRAFMVIAVLATAANAGSITYSSTALSADLRGAASAGASSVYGNLNGSGSPFGLLGASLVTLGTDPGWLVSAPNGFSEPLGIFVGTAFDFVSEVGVIWNGAGTILSTSSGLAFSAVDRFGNFGAIRNSDGASVVGTLNASGNIVSTNVIPRLPGELSGQTRAVDGTISGGSYGIPTGLQAWLAVSGNRINLQNLGIDSAIRSVDSGAGLGGGFNFVGGVRVAAVWRTSDGAVMYFPSVTGTGLQRGEVVSVVGGLVTIKDGDIIFVSDGSITVTFANYMQNLLGVGVPVPNTDRAWFTRVPLSTEFRLNFAGSVWDAVGEESDFRLGLYRPLGEDPSRIPEPATLVLTASALGLLEVRRRKRARA